MQIQIIEKVVTGHFIMVVTPFEDTFHLEVQLKMFAHEKSRN